MLLILRQKTFIKLGRTKNTKLCCPLCDKLCLIFLFGFPVHWSFLLLEVRAKKWRVQETSWLKKRKKKRKTDFPEKQKQKQTKTGG